MGGRACRSRYQHPESLVCERGLGASNWSNWDACCKVRLPATGERGCRSLGPVGPGGRGWRKTVGHRALGLHANNWKCLRVCVFPS